MPALHVSSPRLFRTYRTPKYQTYNCTIVEAARATSAAPTFFKRVYIGEEGLKEEFIDAGLGCNNPTSQLIQEAQSMFPSSTIACIVSIGTGQPGIISLKSPDAFQKFLPLDVIKVLRGIATDCENAATEHKKRYADVPDFYYRFNVEQGLQGVSLAEWDRLGEVRTHTEHYIQNGDSVDQRMDSLVKVLLTSHRQKVAATMDLR